MTKILPLFRAIKRTERRGPEKDAGDFDFTTRFSSSETLFFADLMELLAQWLLLVQDDYWY
jgi:hypothetical protein